jgi:hypothetical protein
MSRSIDRRTLLHLRDGATGAVDDEPVRERVGQGDVHVVDDADIGSSSAGS